MNILARLRAAALVSVLLALPACLPPVQAAPRTFGTLLSYDFDTHAWPGAKTAAVGTVDAEGSAQPSQGLQASQTLSSGPLAIRSTETNLGKLTLAFSLSASAARPVSVRVTSYDAKKKRTGSLDTLVYPAAPDFYQRYALDLSTLKPSGTGKFVPNAPYVGFTFSVGGSAWQGVVRPQFELDNVNYATPAYYVSPKGSDTGDGRTETTAFATPQKALDMAQPGDIVVLMDGTYTGGPSTPDAAFGRGFAASFPRAGTPAAWIVLKNYPGQHPTLSSNGWNIIGIVKGSGDKHDEVSTLAYLEIRGLHVRGEGDVANTKYPDAVNQSDSRTNSNGIGVDGRFMTHPPHHLRIADNLVEFAPGGGIGTGQADWVQVENNVSRSNCWPTIYAPSGISVSGYANFDATDNVYKRLIRNNVCCHNQTYQMWKKLGRYSDGNGIIMDVNEGPDPNGGPNAPPVTRYLGRTLVQNNLCYDNGGGGIHTVQADRVDIINNTVYLNSASVHLEYSEIFSYASKDVRIVNNILVAPVANIAAGEKPEPVNKGGGKNVDVVFAHNLYFGGNIAPTLGDGDKFGDPQFVHPSIDSAVADFHLKPGSPALGAGLTEPFAPFLDFDGVPRRPVPTLGAFQR